MPMQTKLDSDFLYEIVVDCPKCAAAAIVRPRAPVASQRDLMHGPRRAVCVHCGFTRDQAFSAWSVPAMGLKLRLRAATRHGELRFYNLAHIDYVAEYIKAEHRQVAVDRGIRNRAITARLPRWAKLAANRKEILQALDRVRRRALEQ